MQIHPDGKIPQGEITEVIKRPTSRSTKNQTDTVAYHTQVLEPSRGFYIFTGTLWNARK